MSDQPDFQDNIAQLRKPPGAGRRFGRAPAAAASSAAGTGSAQDATEPLRQELHFNPLVGMIFATVVYAALTSGVLEGGTMEKRRPHKSCG